MSIDARQTYMEGEVEQADGIQLVELLYRKAVEAIARARGHLRSGEILPRSRQITRASEILTELALSVDHASGGPLSRNLVELYDYMQHLLQTANVAQTEAPLAEAQRLLETLLEAWEEASAQASAGGALLSVYGQDALAEYVPVDCTY